MEETNEPSSTKEETITTHLLKVAVEESPESDPTTSEKVVIESELKVAFKLEKKIAKTVDEPKNEISIEKETEPNSTKEETMKPFLPVDI